MIADRIPVAASGTIVVRAGAMRKAALEHIVRLPSIGMAGKCLTLDQCPLCTVAACDAAPSLAT
ncbi:MAG: hypothetical protein NVV60_10690 [Luteimonas sp.]|nr:hypothetical protein [Luteimonas sp.]